MSSRNRRRARVLLLAMRAYEQHWRVPGCLHLKTLFEVRQRAALRFYDADDLRFLCRWHLTQVAIDPTVVFEHGGLVFRRL